MPRMPQATEPSQAHTDSEEVIVGSNASTAIRRHHGRLKSRLGPVCYEDE